MPGQAHDAAIRYFMAAAVSGRATAYWTLATCTHIRKNAVLVGVRALAGRKYRAISSVFFSRYLRKRQRAAVAHLYKSSALLARVGSMLVVKNICRVFISLFLRLSLNI